MASGRNPLGTYKDPTGEMSEPTRILLGSHSCHLGSYTDPIRIRFVDAGSLTDPTHPGFYSNIK